MEAKLRIVIIGARWSGKSSSGNTLLGSPRFECGRTRTLQCEVRNDKVCGRSLTVVDVPGWKYYSVKGTSVASKDNFKLSVTQCLPGPHVFLLVIPLDMAFTREQEQYVHEYLSLLGDVWKYVVVLFTCWDYLDNKTTIEEHIKNEGEALQKVLEKCEYRFQVFDNKKNTNPGQVFELLSKIDELVEMNAGGFYKADEKIVKAITEKKKQAKERASQRKMETNKQREKQRELLRELEQEDPITELRVVLLGSRNVGKSSTLNTMLGEKVHESGKMTASTVMHKGHMDQTAVKVVDTPGWWRSFSVKDSTERIKQEVRRSVFLCCPGPHVFLLVIDTDASFTEMHRKALESHLQLLGDNVWGHVIVVFTRGDWLREPSIEDHIEVEGAALTALIDKCGNRYHVLDNKSIVDGTQVTELLQKMKELVAVNRQKCFRCDEKMFKIIQEKQSFLRQQCREKTEEIRTQKQVTRTPLSEIRLVLLGQKTVGKSASGNTILCQGLLPTCFNTVCQHTTAEVAGRKIVMVDTPGWSKYRQKCTPEQDMEIVRGVTLCPPGPHAFLLVLPSDMAFTDRQQKAIEEHMALFGEDVWKFTLVVFTYGDQLGDQTIEEHIMMESSVLQQLVERCRNRYHVLNNKNTSEVNQVPVLLEKIEEMVAVNEGQHYCPNMTEIQQRLDEKFEKQAISLCLEEKWKKREAEMLEEFKDYLSGLLTDLRGLKGSGSDVSLQPKPAKQDAWRKPRSVVTLIKQSKRTEKVEKKISEKIHSIEKELQEPTSQDPKMHSSNDFIWPSFSGSNETLSQPSPKPKPKGKLKDVLAWLSTMKIEKEDPPTLNYSEATSGYQSSITDLFSISEDHHV